MKETNKMRVLVTIASKEHLEDALLELQSIYKFSGYLLQPHYKDEKKIQFWVSFKVKQ